MLLSITTCGFYQYKPQKGTSFLTIDVELSSLLSRSSGNEAIAALPGLAAAIAADHK